MACDTRTNRQTSTTAYLYSVGLAGRALFITSQCIFSHTICSGKEYRSVCATAGRYSTAWGAWGRGTKSSNVHCMASRCCQIC